MTEEQALILLTNITGQIPLKRDEHNKVAEALNVLSELLKKSKEPKK